MRPDTDTRWVNVKYGITFRIIIELTRSNSDQLRNLGLSSRSLIMDRDTKYTNDFRRHLDREGMNFSSAERESRGIPGGAYQSHVHRGC